MSLTVLSVAYPFAPVGPGSTGGAEQVLTMLDQALVAAGHRSIVIACDGSRTQGILRLIPRVQGQLTQSARASARALVASEIERTLHRRRVDVIHLHGVDFASYLPAADLPRIVTLHLPLSWYAAEDLRLRADTRFVCVSRSQRLLGTQHCPEAGGFDVVPNGIALAEYKPLPRQGGFALCLGRVCQEKGYDLALEAARLAAMPLYLAGEVHPYPEHQHYFSERIRPLLDRQRRFLGPVAGVRKRRLLAGAKCVVIPSLVPETSSLVAMEALASGTPVIAMAVGELVNLIDHGRTGFLVRSVEEMAECMRRVSELDRAAALQIARERFSHSTMTARYLELYQRCAAARQARVGTIPAGVQGP